MFGITLVLLSKIGTPMDIGVGGVFYMQTVDSFSYNYYGAEAEFLAQLYRDQLYLRTGLAYFLRDTATTYLGLGSGVGFTSTNVDALFYFTKQKTTRLKTSFYALGGFYFSKVGDANSYGAKGGVGFSYPLKRRGPKLFVEGGGILDAWSAGGVSSNRRTLFARAGARFTILR